MTLLAETKLSDEDKLEVLRRLDQFRQWNALEEKRYCLVCGTLISGRQIQIGGGTRGNGPVAIELSNGTVQLHSNGLGAAHR